MALMVFRVRFDGGVPDLAGLQAAIRELLGCAVDCVQLRAQGNDVFGVLGPNGVWWDYAMRVLTERGAVHVDYGTGLPAAWTCPEYTRKPWLECAHSERVAIDDRVNNWAELLPAWPRFRPRCPDELRRESGAAAFEIELTRVLGQGVMLERLDGCPEAVQARVVVHLVAAACKATEPLHQELARSCLRVIPYRVFYMHLDPVGAGLDFADPVQARRFLETLCVVAPFDAAQFARKWARDPVSGGHALAVELLADFDAVTG